MAPPGRLRASGRLGGPVTIRRLVEACRSDAARRLAARCVARADPVSSISAGPSIGERAAGPSPLRQTERDGSGPLAGRGFTEMPPAEKPVGEAERLAALLGYSVLDTPKESDYDDLVLIASSICEAPTSLITLVDSDRQWFKADVSPLGEHFPRESPREISFCAHAILAPDRVTVVNDCVEDQRFADNPLVAGGAGVRFYAAAPLVVEGHALGTICVADTTPRDGLTPQQEHLLRALSRQVVAQLELRRQLTLVTDLAEQHRDLSERDPLTGLYNRRFFNDELGRRLARGGSGALLLIDLDGFKAINDTFGHDTGDQALVEVANTIGACMRAEDVVARIGGDEFAVVLGRIDRGGVRAAVDKLCRAIEALALLPGDSQGMSASIGAALFTRGGALQELMRSADADMYVKKRSPSVR